MADGTARRARSARAASGPRPGDDGDRPLRADARRNRERVLAAADAVFAAKGASASTEEVARQAGVGVGTVFRHFPTKEALLEAVLVHRLLVLADQARALADADDAGSALVAFFSSVVDRSASKNAVADALAGAGIDVDSAVADAGRELLPAIEVLLTRAQVAGAVRRDLEVADLVALLVGASRASEYARGDGAVRARALRVIVDGLRPPERR